MLHAHPRDGLLAHLRRWTQSETNDGSAVTDAGRESEDKKHPERGKGGAWGECTGAEEAAVVGGLAEGTADGGHAEDGLRGCGLHGAAAPCSLGSGCGRC